MYHRQGEKPCIILLFMLSIIYEAIKGNLTAILLLVVSFIPLYISIIAIMQRNKKERTRTERTTRTAKRSEKERKGLYYIQEQSIKVRY